MSLQLENQKKMKIFNEDPYKSILIMLSCYEKGLEQKHLAYELVKATIDRKGKTTTSNKPRILQERRIVEYLQENRIKGCYYNDKIKTGCIPHRQRLNECLLILKKNHLINKGLKRYVIKPEIKERFIMNYDIDGIGFYYLNSFMLKTMIKTPYVNIYSPSLARMYHKNNTVKKEVDEIVSEIENSIKKLNELTKKVSVMEDKEFIKQYENIDINNVQFYLDMVDGEKIDLDEKSSKEGRTQLKKTIQMMKKRIKKPQETTFLIVIHNRGTGSQTYRTFIK